MNFTAKYIPEAWVEPFKQLDSEKRKRISLATQFFFYLVPTGCLLAMYCSGYPCNEWAYDLAVLTLILSSYICLNKAFYRNIMKVEWGLDLSETIDETYVSKCDA